MKTQSEHERNVIDAVLEIRSEDPGIGGYKLWLMLISMFGRDFVPGRDCFFAILRRRGLILPKPKPRHTTNSNHRYHKWKNLIAGFRPLAANQLWVADITYIPLANGDVCYLHLITDAYSRKIVGWALADTLKAAISLKALGMAIDQAAEMKGSRMLAGLVHHSDRGVQYCCDAYVNVLKAHGIGISMTEDYKPTDNAIAERINGIIKAESIYRQKRLLSLEYAHQLTARFISFYNNSRPHMSIGYKTPAMAHLETGLQQKRWKNKIYKKKENGKENKALTLPGQEQGRNGNDSHLTEVL